jgi:mono/diheme cytochrome c family protein
VELVNPVPAADAAAVERGRAVFASFCAVCHGAGGNGDGPVTRRGVPPPPSLFGENAMGMSDGRMYHIITSGQGNMAAYASQVERLDRWRIIRYIRSLQSSRTTASAAAPAGATGSP